LNLVTPNQHKKITNTGLNIIRNTLPKLEIVHLSLKQKNYVTYSFYQMLKLIPLLVKIFVSVIYIRKQYENNTEYKNNNPINHHLDYCHRFNAI